MNCDSCDEPKNSRIAAEIGFGVDQVVRHQVVGFGLAQAFLDGALDTRRGRRGTGSPPVRPRNARGGCPGDRCRRLRRVPLRSSTQDLDHRQDVVVRQGHGADQFVAADAAVELHAAHGRQVVTLFGCRTGR